MSSVFSKFFMSTTSFEFTYSLCSTWLVWHYSIDLSNLWLQCNFLIFDALIFICTSCMLSKSVMMKVPSDVNSKKVIEDLECPMDVLYSCMTLVWGVTRADASIWCSVAYDPLSNPVWMVGSGDQTLRCHPPLCWPLWTFLGAC